MAVGIIFLALSLATLFPLHKAGTERNADLSPTAREWLLRGASAGLAMSKVMRRSWNADMQTLYLTNDLTVP